MYIEHVQYSAEPGTVHRLIHPDGTAEYRLVADVAKHRDAEGNEVIEGREVYFEIPPTEAQPTEEEAAASFDRWWAYGMAWQKDPPKAKNAEERLDQLERDNITAMEAVAELYEMLMK